MNTICEIFEGGGGSINMIFEVFGENSWPLNNVSLQL
jgi:hypothetical protein